MILVAVKGLVCGESIWKFDQLKRRGNSSGLDEGLHAAPRFDLAEPVDKSSFVAGSVWRINGRPIRYTSNESEGDFAVKGGHPAGNLFRSLGYNFHRWSDGRILNEMVMRKQDVPRQSLWIWMSVSAAPLLLAYSRSSEGQILVNWKNIFPRENVECESLADIFKSIFYGHTSYWPVLSGYIEGQWPHNTVLNFYPWSLAGLECSFGSRGSTLGSISSAFCLAALEPIGRKEKDGDDDRRFFPPWVFVPAAIVGLFGISRGIDNERSPKRRFAALCFSFGCILWPYGLTGFIVWSAHL